MKHKVALLLASTLFLIGVTPALSQITSRMANDSTRVYKNYQSHLDSMFIYTHYSTNANLAALKATASNKASANFEWYVFDYASHTLLNTPIKTDVGVTSSDITGIQENGYMVKVTQGAVVDTFKAWMFLDTLKIDSIFIDNTCGFLKLTAKAQYRANYNYYNFIDPLNAQFSFFQNNFTMAWSADTDITAGVPGSDAWKNAIRSLSTTIDDPAPLKDAAYSVTMTNIFKNKVTASTQTIPFIAVYADFDVLRPNDNGVYTPTTNLEGEALYRVKFTGKSINANEYAWSGYGNQLINFDKDKIIWTANTKDIDNEVDYRPGEYLVGLTVKNTNTGCSASKAPSATRLIVKPSSIDASSIPNGFSPNGDGKNDYFTFIESQKPVSIETIDVKIYNRNGVIMYKYNGAVPDWKGWDGKYMGDKGDCAVGVYYYIITAQGWDGVSYSGKSFTGALHLFR